MSKATPFAPLTLHPDPRLERSWIVVQLGLLVLPFSPFLACLGFVVVLVATGWRYWQDIAGDRLTWGFALLGVLLFTSALFAPNPGGALLGLANFLPFFLMFAVFRTLLQTPDQLWRMAGILVTGSVPVVAIGLGEMFLGWSGHLQWLFVVDLSVVAGGNPQGRMASVFTYANVLASYLSITFALGLGLWVKALRDGARQVLGFWTIALVGEAIALALTHSRNGWGIAGITCIAFALYLGWRWLVMLLGSAAASVLWSAYGLDPLRQWLRGIVPAYLWMRLTDQLHSDRPVALMRTSQWRFAVGMVGDRPWWGWGLRSFTPLYKTATDLWLGHPHNLFLMLGAETGLPAMVLFCGLVGWILARGIQSLRSLENRDDALILFTYLTAFGGCILFNMFDIALFDSRINLVGWLLLSGICGVSICQPLKRKP